GTFDIINPLIAKNKLPNLASFKNKVVLESTIPPGTGVAWASFSTGNLPGKTNIYDFTIVDDNSWKVKIVNRSLLKSKPLWKYLDEAGIKSIFMNIPITYPPEKINGIMISGIDAPSTFSNYVHPIELKEKLKEFGYEIEASGIKEKEDLPDQALNIIDKRIMTANYLLKKEFDFFIMLFRETDVVQHFAWGTDKVEKAYVKIDNFVGEVKKLSKKNKWDLIIMSDHGHERVTKAFNINAWLEKEDYLKTFVKKASFFSFIGINRERIFKILDKLKLSFLVKIVPRKFGKKIPTKNVDFEEAIITGLIDLKNTKVIAKRAVKTAQIFINKESRGGIVKNIDEDKLKNEIKLRLIKFFKNSNIEAEVKTKEELYGKKTRYAPDITIYMKERSYDIQTRFNSEKKIWDEPKELATHEINGIILTDMNLNLKSPRIIDLTPTILSYFGIKDGKFDGKSLL
ncbi:MAG: alkaline phosphatase family protein, partial [Nanoarchaeota archaeon]